MKEKIFVADSFEQISMILKKMAPPDGNDCPIRRLLSAGC